jgi:outer membrane biosynthesis protein TonB
MTNFLRYTYLSLVAYATLAIILLTAFAAHAADVKPSAETKDGTRQIVVEANTSKTPGASPAAQKPAEIKPVADGPADAPAKSAPPAPEAPAAEAAPQPAPAPEAEQPAPKAHTNTQVYGYVAYVHPPRYGYVHSYGQGYGYGPSAGYGYGYGHSTGYDHCD